LWVGEKLLRSEIETGGERGEKRKEEESFDAVALGTPAMHLALSISFSGDGGFTECQKKVLIFLTLAAKHLYLGVLKDKYMYIKMNKNTCQSFSHC
jgi:hypothetical protein